MIRSSPALKGFVDVVDAALLRIREKKIQECCPWCSVLTENFLLIIDLSSILVWNDYISSFNMLLCT